MVLSDERLLRECPFCGGPAITLKDHRRMGVYICCQECFCNTPTGEQKEVTAIWNSRRAAEQQEPVAAHVRFRREAVALALTMDPADFAGDFDPVDDNTVGGFARTLAIVLGGHDWTLDDKGRLAGCVAGDHGYATTGIVVDLGVPASPQPPVPPVSRVSEDVIRELCGDEVNGGLIRDLCFTVWTLCHNPTHEDGNTDWGNDTLPTVQKGVTKARALLNGGSHDR